MVRCYRRRRRYWHPYDMPYWGYERSILGTIIGAILGTLAALVDKPTQVPGIGRWQTSARGRKGEQVALVEGLDDSRARARRAATVRVHR